MNRRAMTWLCLALAACESKPASNVDSTRGSLPMAETSQQVSLEGLGPVKIGATSAQLAAALGRSFDASKGENATCRFVRPASLPKGVDIMLVNDSVARIDVDSAGVFTTEGAGVGDSEERIKQLYGSKLSVRPHKYTGPKGHYLVVTPPGDSVRRIVFETDGERVERYRVGRLPPVEYVERCG